MDGASLTDELTTIKKLKVGRRILLVILFLSASACSERPPTLSLEPLPHTVAGTEVTLAISAKRVPIGNERSEFHFVILIDRDPPEEGELIRKDSRIHHTTNPQPTFRNLSIGAHVFTVVLADAEGRRVHAELVQTAIVATTGP